MIIRNSSYNNSISHISISFPKRLDGCLKTANLDFDFKNLEHLRTCYILMSETLISIDHLLLQTKDNI